MKKKNNKGFTLLELLVAMAIVGIILLSFYKVTNSITRLNVKNDRDIKALNIAQSEIENLRNEVKTKGTSGSIQINNNTEYIPIDEEQEYSYTKSIDNKEFKVNLKISRTNINASRNTNIYLYTISSITVEPNDKYFSKKSTMINNIKILSRNN